MTEYFVGFVFAWGVIDGDTIRADLRIWPNINAVQERIRLARIDTPELRSGTECERNLAAKAAAYVEGLLLTGPVRIEVPTARSRDSFGRLIAEVYVNGVNVSDKLLSEKLARTYGTKGEWC